MSESYDYVKAFVFDGEVTFRYQVPGADIEGSMLHDEDVSDWSEEDIRKLAADLLECRENQVEIIYQ